MIDPATRQLAAETLANAHAALLAEQTPGGFWVGELSASALSTATAVFTLSLHGDPEFTPLVRGGLSWLAEHQNADGGWGDTVKSFSNLSTTCLGWAVFNIPEAKEFAATGERAEGWIRQHAGSLEPRPLSKAVAARYGKDRTFSVPILTMLALAGRLGDDPWRVVPQLPFELAALPFGVFQVLQLPVVSYALPALIAIGQVKHARRPTWNPLTRVARWLASGATLRKLRAIQPTTGGYLEATPLTSFVCMSLIGAGKKDHEVVRHGLEFLANSVRPDGSWPIDTNLTTWVTTLAVNALTVPLSPRGEGNSRAGSSPSSTAPSTRTRWRPQAGGRGRISLAGCPTPTTRRGRCSHWRTWGSPLTLLCQRRLPG
jgi:squalene-hopene/tetraprenyl-beta-curcumene cyclase